MKDISIKRKKEIEEIVKQQLITFGVADATYVDIVSIVKSNGFLVQNADMPLGITGYLAVNDEEPVDESGKYHRLIVVNTRFSNANNDDDVVRKKSRLITAHEYGHFLLHKNEQTIYAHRDDDKRDKLEELEADYFARSILMPMEQFKKAVAIADQFFTMTYPKNFEESRIRALSKIFGTTKDKVMKRLGDMNEL